MRVRACGGTYWCMGTAQLHVKPGPARSKFACLWPSDSSCGLWLTGVQAIPSIVSGVRLLVPLLVGGRLAF